MQQSVTLGSGVPVPSSQPSKLIDAGLLKSSVGVAELSKLEGIEQIKVVNGDGSPLKDVSMVSEHKIFLNSILGLLGTKNQYKTSLLPTEVSVDQIAELKTFLNSKGINTDPLSLQIFTTEATKRMAQKNFANASLTDQDVGVFNAIRGLGSPDPTKSFSLMKYADFRGQKIGIEVFEIEYNGEMQWAKDFANEWNTYVRDMRKRGKGVGA